jgi:hypothetical protein
MDAALLRRAALSAIQGWVEEPRIDKHVSLIFSFIKFYTSAKKKIVVFMLCQRVIEPPGIIYIHAYNLKYFNLNM